MHLKFGTLHPHIQGELAFVQGGLSCSSCDLFLPFSEFHFALCVVNALIKGEIEDQEHPGGRWMTAPQ
jgi:hypothetical protein